jgi:hypothetical protein
MIITSINHRPVLNTHVDLLGDLMNEKSSTRPLKSLTCDSAADVSQYLALTRLHIHPTMRPISTLTLVQSHLFHHTGAAVMAVGFFVPVFAVFVPVYHDFRHGLLCYSTQGPLSTN